AGTADQRREAAADGSGVLVRKRVADDPADVIFAEHRRMEIVRHLEPLGERKGQAAANKSPSGCNRSRAGRFSPPTASRSSCRATTWPIPMPPRCALSS